MSSLKKSELNAPFQKDWMNHIPIYQKLSPKVIEVSQSSTSPFDLMKAIPTFLSAAAIGLCLIVQGCRCEVESNMEKHGSELPWEQIHLQTDTKTFLKSAPLLLGVETEVPEKLFCKDQSFLSVPDLEEKIVVERPAGKHALSNCRIQSTNATRTSLILEILGEFVDNRLSRVSYRFKAEERAQILSALQNRFGKGDTINFVEQSMIEEQKTEYQYWKDNAQIWLLRTAEPQTFVLIQQNINTGMTLPLPKEASKRGEPVSLDDIGIGKLDLKAPLPKLDLPDGGAGLGLPTDKPQ